MLLDRKLTVIQIVFDAYENVPKYGQETGWTGDQRKNRDQSERQYLCFPISAEKISSNAKKEKNVKNKTKKNPTKNK